MSKIRPGNKANAILNGEYAVHVRRWLKKHTTSKRRARNKLIIIEALRSLD